MSVKPELSNLNPLIFFFHLSSFLSFAEPGSVFVTRPESAPSAEPGSAQGIVRVSNT
jgi:hypothetical protein